MGFLGNGGRRHWLLLLLLGLAFFAGLMTSLFLGLQSCKEVFTETPAEVEDPVLLLKNHQAEPDLQSLPSDLFTFRNKCSEAAPLAEVRSMLLNEIFDGVSPFEGFPPPHVAPFLRKERIKGWGSQAQVFHDLLKEVRPQLIVELGTFLGASAIHMANLSQSMGLRNLILCIDDFRGWPGFRQTFKDIHQEHGQAMLYYQFLQNVITTNMTHTIIPIPFSTTSAIAKLCDLGIQADLIEVDAGHDFHSAWADINWAWALLRPGVGIMFGHDYYLKADNRGVGRAVHLFARLKGLHIQPQGSHWILRRPSTSARRSSSVSNREHRRSRKRNRRWQETSSKSP